MSILRRSMTLAPTARFNSASNPAVMLQSLFSLSSSDDAFLFHFTVPAVSSNSAIQGNCATSEPTFDSMSVLC